MSASLFLALLVAAAHAGDRSLYAQARGLYARSSYYLENAQSYTLDVGLRAFDGNLIAFRGVFSPDPIPVYLTHTPKVATGGALVWGYDVDFERLDLVPNVAFGVLSGTNPVKGTPKPFVYFQAGMAVRGRIDLPGGATMQVGPELGVVPLLLAGYIALDVAIFSPHLGRDDPNKTQPYSRAAETPVSPTTSGGTTGSPLVSGVHAIGGRVFMTLPPAELYWDAAAGTATWSPGSTVQTGAYDRYVFDAASLEVLLGGRNGAPTGIVFEIESSEVVHVLPTSGTSTPAGGIRLTTWTGTAVGIRGEGVPASPSGCMPDRDAPRHRRYLIFSRLWGNRARSGFTRRRPAPRRGAARPRVGVELGSYRLEQSRYGRERGPYPKRSIDREAGQPSLRPVTAWACGGPVMPPTPPTVNRNMAREGGDGNKQRAPRRIPRGPESVHPERLELPTF